MNSELDDNFNYACFDEFLILKRQMSGKTVKGYDWSKIIIIVCNILIYINTKKLQHPKMLQIIIEECVTFNAIKNTTQTASSATTRSSCWIE